ncbi:hypothetical protein MRX96_015248 [Rhipicephalus microplus]
MRGLEREPARSVRQPRQGPNAMRIISDRPHYAAKHRSRARLSAVHANGVKRTDTGPRNATERPPGRLLAGDSSFRMTGAKRPTPE